jgi:Pancreatic hormone peptide
MSPRGQLVLCVQVAILWLLALSGHAARSAGDQASAAAAAAASADQITNVNDALKYLREIDKYYAQVARPR